MRTPTTSPILDVESETIAMTRPAALSRAVRRRCCAVERARAMAGLASPAAGDATAIASCSSSCAAAWMACRRCRRSATRSSMPRAGRSRATRVRVGAAAARRHLRTASEADADARDVCAVASCSSCMPPACRTANARTSMRSSCSKAAASGPTSSRTGWLGRALAASGQRGIAMNTAVPLVLRGPADIDTWAPSVLPEPSADLVTRLERLYANDPALAKALARAKGLRSDARRMPVRRGGHGRRRRPRALGARRWRAAPANFSRSRAARRRRCSRWAVGTPMRTRQYRTARSPTTCGSRCRSGGAARSLSRRRQAWSRTVVVVATEFGREVAINGTQGTDHGTGGAAFVLGGAVKAAV